MRFKSGENGAHFKLFFFQAICSNMGPMFGIILFWHHPFSLPRLKQIFLSNITIHFSCDVSVYKDKMMRKSRKIWHFLRRTSRSGWRSSFGVRHIITFPSDPNKLNCLSLVHNTLSQFFSIGSRLVPRLMVSLEWHSPWNQFRVIA